MKNAPLFDFIYIYSEYIYKIMVKMRNYKRAFHFALCSRLKCPFQIIQKEIYQSAKDILSIKYYMYKDLDLNTSKRKKYRRRFFGITQ